MGMTAEQRTARARKAAVTRWDNYKTVRAGKVVREVVARAGDLTAEHFELLRSLLPPQADDKQAQ